jgi:hypothetical protein
VGISKSDIFDVAIAVKALLQSDETKSYLHGLLFDFYSDFVPADGDIPGIPRAVINESLIREQTKEIEKLNREKKPTEEDIERKRELQSEIPELQKAVSQQGETIAHKGGRAKALIPDLIVETIEQKATIVLAYYYHWLVDHENTEKELQQLHEEWPKSKPPPVPPDAKETPVPTAIGFQFFVDECSEVPNIILIGHQRVEKWVTEIAEACADATLRRERPGPKIDTKDSARDQQIYDEYQERRVKEGRGFSRKDFADSKNMKLSEFTKLYKRVHKRLEEDTKK